MLTLSESYAPMSKEEPLVEITCGDALRQSAALSPDAVALVEAIPGVGVGRRWTYSQLLADAERAGRALLSRFEPGSHVAVWASNCPEWVIVQFGLALSGMVLVTVNPAYKPSELKYVLDQSKAEGIFYQTGFRENDMGAALDAVKDDLPNLTEIICLTEFQAFLESGTGDRAFPAISAHDPMMIQYTSGTTGFPKGALLHHYGVANNARLVALCRGAGPDGVDISPMPLFHTGGCVVGVLGSIQTRRTLVLMSAFEPDLLLDLIESEHAEYLFGVPTMLVALLEAQQTKPRDLSSLKVVASGGATVPVDLVKRIERELGASLSIAFGQTETSPAITMVKLDDSPVDKSESLGRPLAHTEVKIIDPDTGATLPIRETGELCTRGYLVMKGYFDNEEATSATIDAEGWLHTGDLCSMDARGYCYVEGRLKDMIIRGGENIYPREIEECLFTHPAIAEVAVVGIPDARWGEQVAAFLRFNEGRSARAAELHDYIRESLASHKTPKIWVSVEQLPLTASGKIQKYMLKDLYQQGELRPNLDGMNG